MSSDKFDIAAAIEALLKFPENEILADYVYYLELQLPNARAYFTKSVQDDINQYTATKQPDLDAAAPSGDALNAVRFEESQNPMIAAMFLKNAGSADAINRTRLRCACKCVCGKNYVDGCLCACGCACADIKIGMELQYKEDTVVVENDVSHVKTRLVDENCSKHF